MKIIIVQITINYVGHDVFSLGHGKWEYLGFADSSRIFTPD